MSGLPRGLSTYGGYEARPKHLGPPIITSVRVYLTPGHWRLHVWVNGARSGELIVREEEGPQMVALLVPGEQLHAALPKSVLDLVDAPQP